MELARDVGPIDLTNPTSGSASISGSSVSVRIGMLSNSEKYGGIIVVDINIDPLAAAVPNSYAVWIDYDGEMSSLSVYAGLQANPKPDNNIAEVPVTVNIIQELIKECEAVLQLQCRQTSLECHDRRSLLQLHRQHSQQGYKEGDRTMLRPRVHSRHGRHGRGHGVIPQLEAPQWRKDLDQLARSMECLPGVPTKIDFSDIKKATGNFHEAMKCTLPFTASNSKTERPMDVAVKRFTRDVQERRYDDFLAEVSIINRLRHKNIVPLVGWSYNKGEPLLVFEFMTNGSLEQHLFPKCGRGTGQQREGHTGAAIRQWATRYDIVKDITTGLHYVHHEYEPMVLHRDIKASNVLLDSSFRARLGDFGLACTVAIDRNSTTGVAGTWGYIAPEYAMCGKATRYTDIYALGVLILEIVTGQRPLIHRAVDDDDVHITDRVWRLHCEGRLLECVDSMLISTYCRDDEQLGVEDDIKRLLLLGLACSNPNPSDRPTMPEVMQIISKAVPPPEVPLMKPSFVWPPPEGVASEQDYSMGTSMTSNLGRSMAGMDEPQSQVSSGQSAAYARTVGGHTSFQLDHSIYVTAATALGSGEIRSAT
ncbi:hypothetical protein ZWY2020_018843 [Hordeum vulgare]|nr:hypothetical protein ZWY2020_018843 [Hordeum vulgare]